MSQISKIQVPIAQVIRERSEQKAKNEGFGSLQEVLRLFLYQYSNNKINISLTKENEPEQLNPEFEKKILEIIEKHEYLPAIEGAEFIKQLERKIEKTSKNKKLRKAA